MNEYYMIVDFAKSKIQTNLSKLVRTDYNSSKIKFSFDKEGLVLFKMLFPDGTYYVTEIENNEVILGAGVLSQEGYYKIEISLYGEDSKLTDYATKKIYVRKELVNVDEEAEVDDRLPVLDQLINNAQTAILESSNLNISGQKVDTTTFITITNKEGQGTTFSVTDGIDGTNGRDGVDGYTPEIGNNSNWYINGVDTGKPSRGEQGSTGQDGITPTIGDNGNWYIGSTDTGKPSRGLQGETGTNGRDGVVQYTAGNNISIDNNVISATVPSNPYQKTVYNLALTTRLSATSDYTYYTNFTSDELTLVSNIITDAKQKGYGDIIIYCNTDNYSQAAFPLFVPKYSNSIGAKETFLNYLATGVVENRYSTSSSNKIISAQLVIQGSWSGDVFTASKIIFYNSVYDYLTKTNTSSYSVNSDYIPAHKKYVDDSISNKIWIGTQTEYDNLSSYNENTLYFIKEDTNAS